MNNRFNECVKAGGSARACRVKQTHQIRLSKCKVVSFQFAPTPSFLLPYFLPCLPSLPPCPISVLPITRHNNIFLNLVWSLVLLFEKARWSLCAPLNSINAASTGPDQQRGLPFQMLTAPFHLFTACTYLIRHHSISTPDVASGAGSTLVLYWEQHMSSVRFTSWCLMTCSSIRAIRTRIQSPWSRPQITLIVNRINFLTVLDRFIGKKKSIAFLINRVPMLIFIFRWINWKCIRLSIRL